MSIVIGPLEQLFVPVLQEFLHVGHELVGDSAIDNAMVVADAEMHHGADGNGFVPVLVGHNDGLFDDSTDAHNRDLRLIDDGHAEFGSEDAGVRDGEGSALNLFGLSFLERARSPRSVMARCKPTKLRSSAFLTTGTISPQSRATAMPRLMDAW